MKKNTKNTILEIQFRFMILDSIQTLDRATVARMKQGPMKVFLANWKKRPNAFFEVPRASGCVSDLCEEEVLRCCGYQGKAPVYTYGENFEKEFERVSDLLYASEYIDITNEDGEVNLSIDPDVIYIPLETLHDKFTSLGYYEEQESLW